MSEMVFNNGSVPVAVAAKVYKKDPCWVRAGLIAGWLPIGFATRDGKLIRYCRYDHLDHYGSKGYTESVDSDRG